MRAAASARLAQSQSEDGSITIAPDLVHAFWPTPLAVLAWSGSRHHEMQRAKAVEFLLQTGGTHWPRHLNKAVGHDTSLRGWPWIAGTHSWVESTALSIIALDVAGHQNHPRVKEAATMLVDRQLPNGGWNYGNTTIFGMELRPSPEYTGAALGALAGRVPAHTVARSIEYLRQDVSQRRTPIALGWGVLGLSAWDQKPENTTDRIAATLARENRFGRYDTASLCLLFSAHFADKGLKEAFRNRGINPNAVVEGKESVP